MATISTSTTAEVTLLSGGALSVTSTGVIVAPAGSTTTSFPAVYVEVSGSGGGSLSSATLLNHGKIQENINELGSYSAPAILAETSLTLNNYSTVIGQSGVYLNSGGVITNLGRVLGDGQTSGGYGIVLHGGSLANSGNIYGVRSGVTAEDGLITNTGSIFSETYGISGDYGTTITNSGFISGSSGGLVLSNQRYSGEYSPHLVNSGTIQGGYFGISINYAVATNASTGVLTGPTFAAEIGSNGSLLNYGKISGSNIGIFTRLDGISENSNTVQGATIGVEILSSGEFFNSLHGYVGSGMVGAFNYGGYLANTGTIRGTLDGINMLGAGTAVNSGTIVSQGEGVVLTSATYTSGPMLFNNSGQIYGKEVGINAETGLIVSTGSVSSGAIGVSISAYGSLNNYGNIQGTSYGIKMTGGAALNKGTISSQTIAVDLVHSSITEYGLISGGKDAVYGNSFWLTLEPGAVINGAVDDNENESHLVLAGSKKGTIIGLGSIDRGFEDITFTSGAQWYVDGNVAGLATHQSISGFAYGDTILLDGFTATTDTFVVGKGLELVSNTAVVTLDIVGSFTTSDFVISKSSAGTSVKLEASTPCFVEGTRILTPAGDIVVENLEVGQIVITHQGDDEPIIWIGKRTINLLKHPSPNQAQPICICANAFDDNLPRRDLWVSPGHAIYLRDHLVPAGLLVNGSSIYQASRVSVTYYHIELAKHCVIFSEGVRSETYLDTGNRGSFENSTAAFILHPNFSEIVRHNRSCAELLTSGDLLREIRERNAARLGGLANSLEYRYRLREVELADFRRQYHDSV